jgi:hypothetical protein
MRRRDHAYEKTISLQPNNVLALNNLGTIRGPGRLERLAISSSVSSLWRPNRSGAHDYLRLGDRESAARERESVRKLDPSAVKQLDEIFNASVKPGTKKTAR